MDGWMDGCLDEYLRNILQYTTYVLSFSLPLSLYIYIIYRWMNYNDLTIFGHWNDGYDG